jgi:hypothetical protein
MTQATTNSIVGLANLLSGIRAEIETAEDEYRTRMDVLKMKRDEVQDKLLAEMRKGEVASVKSSDGTSVYIAKRKGVRVVNEFAVMQYAHTHGLERQFMRLDARMVASYVTMQKVAVDGTEVVETEYIGMRKPKDAPDGDIGYNETITK